MLNYSEQDQVQDQVLLLTGQLRLDDPGVADLEIEGKIFSEGESKAEIFSPVFTY